MDSKREDQVNESFVSLKEAAEILEISEAEAAKLIDQNKLNAYQLDSGLIRIKKKQVWEYQSELRISAELFPEDRVKHHNAPAISTNATSLDRIRDFFYFNDFYLISFLLMILILYLILSSQ